MTICVGIKCQDGIAIASDSMVSAGVLGFYNKKTYNIGGDYNIICSIAGSDSLGKMFVFMLQTEYQSLFKDKNNHYEIANAIRDRFVTLYLQTIPMINRQDVITNLFQQSHNFGNNRAFIIYCEVLIAFTFKGEYYLFSFGNAVFEHQIINEKSGFFHKIIGSGNSVSSPLIKMLIDILDIKNIPTLQQGKKLAYWLTKYAIDSASQGIGDVIEMCTIENINNNFTSIDCETGFVAKEIDEILKYIKKYKPKQQKISKSKQTLIIK